MDVAPTSALDMSVPNEGAAPQNVTPAIKTSAYYVGTSFLDGSRYHTFHKNFSDRGLHGSGDRSPHGRDMETTYHSLLRVVKWNALSCEEPHTLSYL